MSLTLYGLKNCDTCKKALKALESAGKTVEFVDIRAGADLTEKVPAWLETAGPVALVNTRSATWRGLSPGEKDRTETDPDGLLVDHPTLIKRPVIEAGGHVHAGWTKPVQDALL